MNRKTTSTALVDIKKSHTVCLICCQVLVIINSICEQSDMLSLQGAEMAAPICLLNINVSMICQLFYPQLGNPQKSSITESRNIFALLKKNSNLTNFSKLLIIFLFLTELFKKIINFIKHLIRLIYC